MNNDALEGVGSFWPDFGKRLSMQEGTCEAHGAASVLTLVGRDWHCPKCLDAAMKADTDAIVLAERAAWLMKVATIPAKYVGQRFIASTPEQVVARNTVRAFRDFIVQQSAWAALILAGRTGTGKTLLACQFAQSLISNAARSVRYITAKGMISEIQASYGREGKSEEGEILRFAQYDVLILDEIDAIPARENSSLLLTEIVNRRYNDNKPVVAISNQPLEDLAKFVGDRVHSRLHENSFPVAFTWADARKGSQA